MSPIETGREIRPTEEGEDWRQLTDAHERRRVQNRIAQRNYRKWSSPSVRCPRLIFEAVTSNVDYNNWRHSLKAYQLIHKHLNSSRRNLHKWHAKSRSSLRRVVCIPLPPQLRIRFYLISIQRPSRLLNLRIHLSRLLCLAVKKTQNDAHHCQIKKIVTSPYDENMIGLPLSTLQLPLWILRTMLPFLYVFSHLFEFDVIPSAVLTVAYAESPYSAVIANVLVITIDGFSKSQCSPESCDKRTIQHRKTSS